MFDLHSEAKKTHKLLSIAGIALLLGITFDYFFYGKLPGISFPLFVLLILVGLVVLARQHSVHIPRPTWFLAAAALFFSSMLFVYASEALNFFNVVATVLLMLMVAVSVVGKTFSHYWLADYARLAIVPLKFLRTALATVAEIVTLRSNVGKNGTRTQVVKGIILAVPVLVLFLVLFSSADLVFAKYLKNVLDINIDLETFSRALIIFIVTFVFIGAYVFSLRRQESHAHDQPSEPKRVLGLVESSILLGSVNAIFLLFVLIQLTYLFGGEANITSQGFTYAEYARKGFFELVMVGAVSLLLLLATEKYIVKKELNHTGAFKFLSGALALQVFVIIISAFRRLMLYEQAYGFTIPRLFSHVFTIWLGIIFLLLLYKIFVNSSEQKFVFYGFLSVLLVFAALNVVNPEAFIARQNLERYEKTGKLDAEYLATLSEDAVDEKIAALNVNDEAQRAILTQDLYRDYDNNTNSSWHTAWQSTNLSRRHAVKALESNIRNQ